MGHLTLEKSKLTGKPEDSLNISGKHASGRLSVFKYQDKDTLHFVFYCPSLEVSGYGNTTEEAGTMLEHSIYDFFEFLVNLPNEQRVAELSKLGWRKKAIFNKRYSRAFVDGNGELQNFNAVDNKVERLTATA